MGKDSRSLRLYFHSEMSHLENAEYCRECGEYHHADSPEEAANLVADCEAGNW